MSLAKKAEVVVITPAVCLQEEAQVYTPENLIQFSVTGQEIILYSIFYYKIYDFNNVILLVYPSTFGKALGFIFQLCPFPSCVILVYSYSLS